MCSSLKTLVGPNEWDKYVETLISEALEKKDTERLLIIFIQEKKWDKYMEYIRKNPSTYTIDCAPDEVKKLFKEEIIGLYATAVNNFLSRASSRGSYYEGVCLLRNLISYGGKAEADQIVLEQKSKKPSRPALIEELAELY